MAKCLLTEGLSQVNSGKASCRNWVLSLRLPHNLTGNSVGLWALGIQNWPAWLKLKFKLGKYLGLSVLHYYSFSCKVLQETSQWVWILAKTSSHGLTLGGLKLLIHVACEGHSRVCLVELGAFSSVHSPSLCIFKMQSRCWEIPSPSFLALQFSTAEIAQICVEECLGLGRMGVECSKRCGIRLCWTWQNSESMLDVFKQLSVHKCQLTNLQTIIGVNCVEKPFLLWTWGGFSG